MRRKVFPAVSGVNAKENLNLNLNLELRFLDPPRPMWVNVVNDPRSGRGDSSLRRSIDLLIPPLVLTIIDRHRTLVPTSDYDVRL